MEQVKRFGSRTFTLAKQYPAVAISVAVVIMLILSWGRVSKTPLIAALSKTLGTVGAVAVAATSVADEAVKDFTKLVRVFGPLGSLMVMLLVFTETGRAFTSRVASVSFDALKRGGRALRDISNRSETFRDGLENGDADIVEEAAKVAEAQIDIHERLSAESGSGDRAAIEKLEAAFESHSESVARAFEELAPEAVSEAVDASTEGLEAEAEVAFEDIHPVL